MVLWENLWKIYGKWIKQIQIKYFTKLDVYRNNVRLVKIG